MNPPLPDPPGSPSQPPPPLLGVVIPTLNEEAYLPALLSDLARLPIPHRVVVADGGSLDSSTEVARREGAGSVEAPRGRARQMNAGAALLDTPWLLFLHADSRIPAETGAAMAEWIQDPPPEEAGHFRFQLDGGGWTRWIIEGGQRVREGLSGLAYGDQGLLLSRERFLAVGGFPDLPLMEDVEMVRRLRRTGGLARVPAPLVTSARRYREEGWFRAWIRNATLLLLHGLGVPTSSLVRWYPPRAAGLVGEDGASAGVGASGAGRALMIFAKAPRIGQVKTRLAEGVGAPRAVEIYRRLGREVVDRLRHGGWDTVIFYDPPDAQAAMKDWLGVEALTFHPQEGEDLGARLSRAFQHASRQAGPMCVVGTDIPDLDGELVETAFRRLEAEDGPQVILGPAKDGGYYLLALRSPEPRLFQGIRWSTERVREQTLDRARELGLSVEELPVLADVDRVEDLPPAYR
ncbi:MAG: DUF2064 domain-containing protein [Gemmatimonadales bacterium]|nr:MAG: DUF2064 domain-containing protein [Gemmatimonadales bacterium]